MTADQAPGRPSRQNPSGRSSAFRLLLSAEKGGELVDDAFDRTAARDQLDARERSLMVELVRGVFRHRGTLDWRLGLVADRPIRKLPLVVQTALRLGAYQILHLDKIPESAAVNESVRLVKMQAKRVGRDWSGFVNAVLRALIRTPAVSWPSADQDPVAAWSVRYSCPAWVVERWISHGGRERAEALCRASVESPPLTLRANTLRCTRQALLDRLAEHQIDAVATAVSPVGVRLASPCAVTELPGYAEGWFYVEDEAAQLVPPLLDVRPGERVLDACAAPGGKATHLAALMENQGTIVAVDRAAPRLDKVMENCRRLGVSVVRPVVADLRQLGGDRHKTGEFKAPFDRILLDAPCSGLGVLRRHPEGKWFKSEATIAQHAVLQSELLSVAYRLLRPGGALVYSTCSAEPEETESVVENFCQLHRDGQPEPLVPYLPEVGVSLVTSRGGLSTMVNPFHMDAFYAARLRRSS
ncbi:MAG: 16S rRNA (cytosine(967)-C(5))-methyltransferase RsmB [Nitrospiraceae bacterium]